LPVAAVTAASDDVAGLASGDGGAGSSGGAFSRCDPDLRIRKERSDVNSLNHLYVAARQNEMLRSAANERLATQADRGNGHDRKARLSAAAKGVWSFFNGPAERPMTLPTLVNYPYRG